MARVKNLIPLLATLTVLIVVIALIESSLGVKSPGRKFDCKKCRKLCRRGVYGALVKFCARCSAVCGSTKGKNDPWLKITMMKKQIRNGTNPLITTKDIKVPAAAGPTADQQGRAMEDGGEEASESPIDETEQSGMTWWGRR